MADLSTIKPGFRIITTDGALIGFVDAVEGGERIRVRAPYEDAFGGPDLIPSSWVAGIGTDTVQLNRSEMDAAATVNDEIPAGDTTS